MFCVSAVCFARSILLFRSLSLTVDSILANVDSAKLVLAVLLSLCTAIAVRTMGQKEGAKPSRSRTVPLKTNSLI